MTYREKLELYSQGKLDEQEKIEIEKELEKQESLTDYLFEHQAPPGMEDIYDGTSPFDVSERETGKSEAGEESETIAKQINSSIRKAFIKTGTIAIIIALLLTLFIVFALPHIVSSFYYDPGKVIGTDLDGNEIEQLERDMSVYAELSIPELGPQISIGTDGYGYGNHSFFADAAYRVNPEGDDVIVNKTLTGIIKRNSFICYNYRDLDKYLMELHDASQNESNIDSMNDNDLYYAYVDLKDVVPYETFYTDYVENGDPYGTSGSWVWCAAQVSEDESTNGYLNRGFYATANGQFAHYSYDANAYPMLAWADDMEDLDTEAKAKEHFTSMLSYILDNKKFNSLEHQLQPWVSDSEKEYVEKNGINVYGFIYVSDKAHIEEIAKAEGVNKVYVDRAL